MGHGDPRLTAARPDTLPEADQTARPAPLLGRAVSSPFESTQPSQPPKQASGHRSYPRVIEHHGAGRAEGQESSGPGVPAQGSPHPVGAAKYVRRLQHGCHHAAGWSEAEYWGRTSAL